MILPIGKIVSCVTAATVATTSKVIASRHISSSCLANGVILDTTSSTAATAITGGSEICSNAVLNRLRGGQISAHAAAAIDLSRESHSLSELATYGTLTALVMNAALRLWTSTKFSKDQSPIVTNAFTISTVLCVIAGAFTAILFQLLGIYSKSALSFGNDQGYLAFKTATALSRKIGFRCFLTELSTFVFSFLISVYDRLWKEYKANPESKPVTKRVGIYILTGSVFLCLVGLFHIQHVLSLATKHIFTDAFHDKFA